MVSIVGSQSPIFQINNKPNNASRPLFLFPTIQANNVINKIITFNFAMVDPSIDRVQEDFQRYVDVVIDDFIKDISSFLINKSFLKFNLSHI
jgi:hypothetical protein